MTYREPDRDPREEALEEVLRELDEPSTFERPDPEARRTPGLGTALVWVGVLLSLLSFVIRLPACGARFGRRDAARDERSAPREAPGD